MAVREITTADFDEVIKANDTVLVDFYAVWCGPCKMLAPVISQIAAEHPEIKVGKVNVDEQPELAAAFNVSSIPMVVLVKDGRVVNSAVGYRPKSSIEAMFA